MAKEAHLPVADQMNYIRHYASRLYGAGDWEAANKQIADAIAICPAEPKSGSEEADLLASCYQWRASNSYNRHFEDPGVESPAVPSFLQDQEHALAIAEKAFGPDSRVAVRTLPLLAVMYKSQGKADKAEATMKRALDTANKKESAKEIAWIVYSEGAEYKLMQGDYNGTIESFSKGVELARKTADDSDENVEQVWDDLDRAMARQLPDGTVDVIGLAEPGQQLEFSDLPGLLKKQKWEELDKIAEKLQKSQAPQSNGSWKLDRFFKVLLGDDSWVEKDYPDALKELQVWIKERPQSPYARVALARAYLDYAWEARGSGYANTVSDEGWEKFRERLEQSRAVLDEDPKIKSKCPSAFVVYAELEKGQSGEKEQYKDLVASCHKTWPAYNTIDLSAVFNYLPRWHGEPGEAESYILTRSDTIGGAKGDELYAQLVWWNMNYLDDLFHGSPIKFARVKEGFKQIFKDFPGELKARLAYLRLCAKANDLDAMKMLFEGYPKIQLQQAGRSNSSSSR